MRAALVIGSALVAATAIADAGPLPKAPPASTEPSLPPGMTLEPLHVPTGPAFTQRAPTWWKKKKPCPPGAKLQTIENKRKMRGAKWAKAFICRDAAGKQHGPGIGLFDDDTPYEDSWSEHGKRHGARFTWRRDGKMDHMETFVDGELHGPAAEWSGGELLRRGQYKHGKSYGLWTEHHPNGLERRGHYRDGGHQVGTWIGTRAGVATAIVVEEHGSDGSATLRIFDASGQLTFERRLGAAGGVATAYQKHVRIAEYECGADGTIGESRFYDDKGVLRRRWDNRTWTLTDHAGVKVAVTDEQRRQLTGVRDACSGPLWHLEGPPPSRHAAFGKPPPKRTW